MMANNWYLLKQIMELNTDMASLELLEDNKSSNCAENPEESENFNEQILRRSARTRKKINHISHMPVQSVKSEKKDHKNSVERYYLSQKVKRLPSTLETIYEEPKSSNDRTQYMSSKKFKRILTFDEANSSFYKIKRSKKRQMKAKKVTANYRVKARKKLSMDILMQKLQSIEDTD